MTDTASLKIAIETSDVKKANDELGKLSTTASKTEKAFITLKSGTKAYQDEMGRWRTAGGQFVSTAEKMANGLDGVGKSTLGVTKSFLSLGRVLSSMALLGTTQQFIKMADTMTGVESKLKLVTNNTLDLIMAQQELFEISQKTRTGFANNVDLYQKMSMSTKELNLSQKEIFELINSINKSIAISGTNAAGAETLITQLGQAFSSNFQGVAQELGTLRDQAPRLYQAILEGTGMTSAAFKKAAEDGKLSSEIIIDALRKQGIAIDKDFGKVGVTVDASMTVLANSITNMIGKVDKQLGTTGSFGKLIIDVSKHIDENTKDWVDSVQEAMDKMYPIAEAGFTNIRDLSEVTFEGVNSLFSVMVHTFDGAIDSMDNKYRELGFFDYMSLGFIVVIEGFRQIASGGLSALTFLGKQFNTFQSIALDAIAGVMGAMGKFQNAVGGDGSSFLEAQAFWADKANKVKQDGLLIDRTQKAILDDMGKGVDRLIASYDKLALKKVKAKKVDADTGDTGGSATTETDKPKKGKAGKSETEKLSDDIAKAKLDAAEYNAEQEAALALSVYQAELDAIQHNHDVEAQLAIDLYQSQLDAIEYNAQRQSELALAFYEMTRSETDVINEKMMEIYEANSGLFSDEQMQTFFEKWQESIDGVKGGYNDISSMVDNLKLGDDFSESFTGMAKSIANASKAIKNFSNIAEDAAEAKKAVTSSKSLTEEQKAVELKKLENKEMQAQIGAYANLAGAASMFFEEGSKGAKTLAIAQSGLAMVSAVAGIAEQAKLPFPANIAAMLGTAGTVFGFLSQAGIMGGGGGGYTTPQSITDVQTKQEAYKSETEAITSRLDRSNELLEIIGKTGSAAQVDVLSKKIAYDRTLGDLSYTVAQDVVEAVRTEQFRKDAIAQLVTGGSAAAGVSIGSVSSRGAYLDTTVLAGNIEASVRYINFLSQNIDSINFDAIDRFERADVTGWVDDILEAVADFSTGLIDNINALKDASGEFQDTFDSLTGTTTYSMQRLQRAYSEVNNLVGDSTLPEYLARQIENIEKLNLSQSDIQTLLIQDTSALIDQEKILSRISGELGVAFEGGAKDALDYLESINLVAEAMIRSRENASKFLNSLLSQQQQAESLANIVGVQLAGDVGGLADLFIKLRDDIDGLTDADMDVINANLELLKSTDSLTNSQNDYNDSLTKTQESLSTLQGALGSIQNTIDKLRGAAGGADYTMEMFRQSMATALSLSGTDNYADFAKAVHNASGYSSALLDSSNFSFSRDQKFAQAVAANQFASLEDATLNQIDYLKMIEENTRAMVMQLSGSIDNLSSSINSQLATEIVSRGTPDILKEQWVNQGSGVQTWLSSGGASAINNTITDKLGETYQISDMVAFVNMKMQAGDLKGIYDEAIRRGISSKSLENAMGWAEGSVMEWVRQYSAATGEYLPAFAQGTQNVPYDMVAQIHKGEAIVPKPQAEAWRNGRAQFGMNADGIITAINNLGSRMASVEKVLNDSRDIQSGCLETLQLIEEVS